MAKKFLVSIDLTKQELQNAALHNLATAPSSPSIGQVYYNTVDLKPYIWDGDSWNPFGEGTVTSVALALPSIFSVSGSPITTSGTLTATLASQAANTVFAAPDGSAGTPSFRSLLASDIPNLDAGKITTGLLPVARGGTGVGTLTGIVVGNGTSAMTAITGTASQLLRRNAGNTAYEFFTHDFINQAGARTAISLTTTGSSGAATYSSATGVFNIPTYTLAGLGGFANPMTTLGDIIYGAVSGAPTRLAGNTTTAKQYLSQTGTGSASAAPVWSAIAGADVTGAALTKTDDTNVTLTLGGTPATALLRAASITVGWTGTLAVSRGGTGAGTLTGVVIGNGTSAMTAISGTALQVLRRNSGNTAYEFVTPGTANTLATLDSNGKIPTSQIPDAVLGQVEYINTWDASTNTPTLPSPTGVKGDYYVVSVSGTQTGANFEGGSLTFAVGDWVISNGTVWQKVDNTDAVVSVFGRIGAITADAADYNGFYVRHDTAAQGLTGTQQSNARTNINAQVTITGAASTVTTSNLTINRALISNGSGKIDVSTVTATELEYVSGVTSSIQTQLNSKFTTPAGTTLQYVRGDGSLATFPTLISQLELNTGTATTERLISAERIATWYATKTFTQSIGNASATSFNIDHNLNSRDVIVQVYDTTTNEDVEVDIVRSTVNRVIVTFNVAPASNAYRVVVKI